MALAPYEFITSLGDWCAPAANIRRYFGLSKAMPFDWWISPFDATMKLLEENFANLLRPENLEITDAPGPNSVRCNHYGILHHHDFERDGDERIVPELVRQLPNVAQKTRFILDRFFLSFAGKRALVIRNSLHSKLWFPELGLPYIYPTAKEQIDQATKLHALMRNRLSPGHLDIVVLSNLPRGTTLSLEGGSVIFESLGDRIGESFFWDENYDMLFERLGIELVPAAKSVA